MPRRESLYHIAQQVTDEVMGAGTYARINHGNPNPGVQAAIRDADYDPARIVETLMDGVRAARADSRRTDNNIADAKAALDDLASDLPPVERARFWRAVFGYCASQVRRTAIKPPTPTAEWLPGGANYDAMAQEDRFDKEDAMLAEKRRRESDATQ